MQIGDNLHEMSKPVFWEGVGEGVNVSNLLSAELAQRVVKVKLVLSITLNSNAAPNSKYLFGQHRVLYYLISETSH